MTIEDNGYAISLRAKDVVIAADELGREFFPALLAQAQVKNPGYAVTSQRIRGERVTIHTATESLTTYIGHIQDELRGINAADQAAALDFEENQG